MASFLDCEDTEHPVPLVSLSFLLLAQNPRKLSVLKYQKQKQRASGLIDSWVWEWGEVIHSFTFQQIFVEGLPSVQSCYR